MATPNRIITVPPTFSSQLQTIDYSKTFPKNYIGTLCRLQLFLCSFAIITETVWLITGLEGRRFPGYHVSLTASGIWCGILGIVPASFGLWIRTKPSRCTINTFMALSIINGCLFIAFLTLAAFKASMIRHYNWSFIPTTMSVLQIMVGVLQEVVVIISIIFAIKSTCFEDTRKNTVYYAKTTVNENGEEVFQLVPMQLSNGNQQEVEANKTPPDTTEKCQTTINCINSSEMNNKTNNLLTFDENDKKT